MDASDFACPERRSVARAATVSDDLLAEFRIGLNRFVDREEELVLPDRYGTLPQLGQSFLPSDIPIQRDAPATGSRCLFDYEIAVWPACLRSILSA